MSTVLIVALLVLFVSPLFACAREAGPVPVEIISGGAKMHGQFFVAECEGACPTLLLAPGWPGNPHDVLGMGAMLSEKGINVLIFNPRGMHQSGGTASAAHFLEDIGAAFEWLYDPDVNRRFGIDTSSIVIGGYSVGGGMAMIYAARNPRARRVLSVAANDFAEYIRGYQRNQTFAERVYANLQATQSPGGPVRFDVDSLLQELAENQNVYGLRENAERLADRTVLIVGGWEDTVHSIEQYQLPFYRALKRAGADDVTFLVFHANHGFGQVRERLADDIRSWILQVTSQGE